MSGRPSGSRWAEGAEGWEWRLGGLGPAKAYDYGLEALEHPDAGRWALLAAAWVTGAVSATDPWAAARPRALRPAHGPINPLPPALQARLWVHDGTAMVCREVSYVPGLYKIFDEILVRQDRLGVRVCDGVRRAR